MYSVEITGHEALLDTLNRLLSAGENTLPAMQDIGEYLIGSTRQRFHDMQGPNGEPWVPNTETTQDATEARGDRYDPRPLFGPTKRLSSEILAFPSNHAVAVGSALIQAAVMQFGAEQGEFGTSSRGGPLPWGDIPARPFIGISDADEVQVLEILNGYLAEALETR
ncbi:phage virion morphogenesis protein [Halomonas sp. JS92-SW72]|uniref:phage virion morphogenesis protein n=1 Tax=Halomonas sp. JS92-SW72 TaxID=2306583 RepID=UPI0013C342E7|nr:phage virion morphogenesis protein [Halomonas sp. JS92-SW72]